jgi:hypothetical protein
MEATQGFNDLENQIPTYKCYEKKGSDSSYHIK